MDVLIEAEHSISLLPEEEFITRLGRSPAAIGDFGQATRKLPLISSISVEVLELLKSCFVETLFFFSAAEYEMRTGWTRDEGHRFLGTLMAERNRMSIERQWG